MKRDGDHLRLSATDVTTFAACAHATALNVAVAEGTRPHPPRYTDVAAQLLAERGLAHEAAHLATLRKTRTVEEIPTRTPDAAQRTLDAMQRGVEVVYQGTLRSGRWLGMPDFLVRVARPHGTWGWSYEAVDAKLALTAKVHGLLQLCFYSELLARLQGAAPERMTLVLGDMREETFATAGYEAYFRWVRGRLEQVVASPVVTYPEPVDHCDVCDWAGDCRARRRADDHLSLVAGITGSQRRALDLVAVRKVVELATLAPDGRVEGIGRAGLTRVREQARVQVRGRDAGALVYELIPDAPDGHGLMRLPAPSPGDLFVDLEGDAYALGEGIEYLFGIAERPSATTENPRYTALWALDHASERIAFEKLMAIIAERRAQHPDMHVYHYAPYEPTAFKRLAGRYATCVDSLDELLRAKVFVDLYGVVKQGVRASVESYSIKRLEPLYGYERDVPLPVANRNLAAFAAWLERRAAPELPEELRAAVEGYNRDDCVSAFRLHAWLEARRSELEAQRGPLPRPERESGEAPDKLEEQIGRVREVMSALLAGVPQEREDRDEAQNARFVLAHLLEWHRREDKSTHWEYFRLCELPEQDLVDERTPIGGLTYVSVVGKEARSLVHRYRFPPQDQAIDRARQIHDPRTKSGAGTRVQLDATAGILDLKRVETSTVAHPTAVIPYEVVPTPDQRASLLRLGEHVRAKGTVSTPPLASALALLLRDPPRASAPGASAEETAILRALAVKGSVLPVQGPPGTGKTYLGARMIVALLKAGKRVGITANSHRVITGLLDEALKAARRESVDFRAIQKKSQDGEDYSSDPLVTLTDDNAEVREALAHGTANVAVGTSWLWAREDMAATVDVLFVDEAGQMSLANVLAAAPAAGGIVLLGDPQQLDQPQKGVHPPGVAVSALGHIVGDDATMSAGKGLFLEETWRMHPDVCAYISEVFYEGRLRTRPDLSRIRLDAPEASLSGTGLRFVPVEHRGNRSESVEEAEAVAKLVERLIDGRSTWTDREGEVHVLRRDDVLVVAPYNAHIAMLRKHVPGVIVGTVDKFQGREAPVVIYSMATSSPEDAPRGMEFLYSGNRLNVAISRARCSAFLVANPGLFDVKCKSGRQMALVNAFCRYLEMARAVISKPGRPR